MKKNNKDCSLPIPQCDILGGTLIRMGVGLFFFAFGAMKLMGAMKGDPMIAGMVQGIFGVEGILLTLLVWGLIFSEFLGGAIVILGKMVPRLFYQLALIGFLIIDVVGMVAVFSGDVKQLLWHGMLLLVLLGLLVSTPKCCCGMTGDNK